MTSPGSRSTTPTGNDHLIRTHLFPYTGEPVQSGRPGALRPPLAGHRAGERSLLLVGECFLDREPVGPEQLLSVFEAQGVKGLDGYQGTFALEITDRERGEVTLLQGPFGHRHLYFREEEGCLIWGTDPKGMFDVLPRRRMNRVAMQGALNSRWCIGESSLVDGVRQLFAATALTFDGRGDPRETRLSVPRGTAGPDQPWEGWVDESLATIRLEMEAVLARSDRPTVLLSGGVDSALLTALAKSLHPDVVAVTPTWISHHNPELERASRVAEHLGVPHRVIRLTDQDFANAAEEFVGLLGLLPRDYWAVVLLATFRQIRGETDRVLHGQGADSLFGGAWIIRRLKRERQTRFLQAVVPSPIRGAIARLLPLDTSHLGDLRAMLLDDLSTSPLRRGLAELHRSLRHRHHDLFGEGFVDPSVIERYWGRPAETLNDRKGMGFFTTHRFNLIELTGVSDDTGIPISYPFFSKSVMDLAGRLPTHRMSTKESGAKPILRMAYARFFPAEWAEQRKLAFPTPHVEWMGGCLKPWLDDRLGPDSFGGRALGATMDELELERDHQLLWTLACMEEFVRAFDLEPPEFDHS